MTNPLGLYLHIPFCDKKCAYCDFYSVFPIGDISSRYLKALIKEIKKWGGILKNRPIDTIYIGGGTPSLLGKDIITLLDAVRQNFNVLSNAEITAEANPENTKFLDFAKKAGVNRLSVGAQTFCDDRLSLIGRRHTAQDTKDFVKFAKEKGFNNISLDIILGLPESDLITLNYDLEQLVALNPQHISAYILKKEQNTAFGKTDISVPDDDNVSNQYLKMCDVLEKAGFNHYEISNFAKNGFSSIHNTKYWLDEEYLGIGPAAHSFISGKRFFYPRDIKKFILNPEIINDGTGGENYEKLMLSLRLKSGVDLSKIYNPVPEVLKEKFIRFKNAGLMDGNFPKVHLTDRGMLLSNALILELTV